MGTLPIRFRLVVTLIATAIAALLATPATLLVGGPHSVIALIAIVIPLYTFTAFCFVLWTFVMIVTWKN